MIYIDLNFKNNEYLIHDIISLVVAVLIIVGFFLPWLSAGYTDSSIAVAADFTGLDITKQAFEMDKSTVDAAYLYYIPLITLIFAAISVVISFVNLLTDIKFWDLNLIPFLVIMSTALLFILKVGSDGIAIGLGEFHYGIAIGVVLVVIVSVFGLLSPIARMIRCYESRWY